MTMPDTRADAESLPESSRWLTQGLEQLITDLSESRSELDFDVVIIGSGYGAAIAASQLAGTTDHAGRLLNICVLERGSEYLSGTFPSGLSTLAGHVRLTTPGGSKVNGNRTGLFDIRAGDDVNALVASGLGGGSLINAGVMEIPSDSVFNSNWPDALSDAKTLEQFYTESQALLGATRRGKNNTLLRHKSAPEGLPKTNALKKLGKDTTFRPALITVAMEDGPNQAGVEMNQCQLCGDCATGCNYNAKNSLDLNLLATAQKKGVRFVSDATVVGLTHSAELVTLDVVHTDQVLAQREGGPLRVTAGKVILSAGALGSTELLLRAKKQGLPLSTRVGEQFSTNGDTIAVGFDQSERVNAVAHEGTASNKRRIGPTITGVIDHRNVIGDEPIIIEEMAVPGAMRRIFEEIFTTANTLHELAIPDRSVHSNKHPDVDPLSVDSHKISHTSLYAMMGDDGANGTLELSANFDTFSDGAIQIKWPSLRKHQLYSAQLAQLRKLTQSSAIGGTVIPNPATQPFPEELRNITGNIVGPAITVHPLGGVPMGNDRDTGAVDHLGRVFDVSSKSAEAVYDNLVVLDGSIIPTALGTNPALTIAAVSLRAIRELIKAWDYIDPKEEPRYSNFRRPPYTRLPPPDIVQPTMMQFAERLSGQVNLRLNESIEPCTVEITLFFEEKSLRDLTASTDDDSGSRHQLTVATHTGPNHKVSQLRVWRQEDREAINNQHLSGRSLEKALSNSLLYSVPLGGSLTILARERSSRLTRTLKSTYAWFRNRGVRDIWQKCFPQPNEASAANLDDSQGFWDSVNTILNTASRAGELRLFEYDLAILPCALPSSQSSSFLGEKRRIQGRKHITYNRRANPLRQLMEMTLTEFPSMEQGKQDPVLVLAPEFLARKGLPLFRITQQQDEPQALADVISLVAYFLRLLVSIHLLSFRKPDSASAKNPQRLPGRLAGLPAPEYKRITIDQFDAHTPVREMAPCLLTRYRHSGTPVIMIHGYSASGTSFAHHSVNPNLASYLWRQGHDVWILDMRSSCGMKTATTNYRFEELAYADIPIAIDHIYKQTGCKPVNVIAHCMGAAMLSMAILNSSSVKKGDVYAKERKLLPKTIRRVVLSQVGPLVSMAPENIFRAYAFGYLKHFVRLEDYSFNPSADDSMADQILDRLLSVLPYSAAEYDLENPCVPWKRTAATRMRHRMDALYGRTFSLKNLGEETLSHLSDFFGPLSVDTATQVAHFAKLQTITDHGGNNQFVSRKRLQANWTFPTLSIHGADNGLADVSTVGRMQSIMTDAGRNYQALVFEGFGHQDCLIGKEAEPIFRAMNNFLVSEHSASQPLDGNSEPKGDLLIQPPWSGPIIGSVQNEPGENTTLPVMMGINPALSPPVLLVSLPLKAARDTLDLSVHQTGDKSTPSFTVHVPPKPVDGWIKLQLPLPRHTRPEALLILLAYDESHDLDNAVYGQDSGHIDSFASFDGLTMSADLLGSLDIDLVADFSERLPSLVNQLGRLLGRGPSYLSSGIVTVPPTPRPDALCFAFGSCQYPPGILDQKPGFDSYRRLAARFKDDSKQSPEFTLLMGDQVYIDPTAGLFDPTSLDERFIHPYQRWLRNKSVREVFRQAPVYTMLDDHEISDNWQPLKDNEPLSEDFVNGVHHYINFQRGDHLIPSIDTGTKSPDLWYSFKENEFDFFVLDTRTDRQPRSASSVNASELIGEAQWKALESWLRNVAKAKDRLRPKFIVSAAMFLPRHRSTYEDAEEVSAIRSDGWDGYPKTQQRLLQLLAVLRLQNLIFLSGDAHLSCVARATLQPVKEETLLTFWSIHSSPLYAPFPFANTSRSAFAQEDQFSVPPLSKDSSMLNCRVTTQLATAGSGFSLLSISKQSGQWVVECEFDRGLPQHGNKRTELELFNGTVRH